MPIRVEKGQNLSTISLDKATADAIAKALQTSATGVNATATTSAGATAGTQPSPGAPTIANLGTPSPAATPAKSPVSSAPATNTTTPLPSSAANPVTQMLQPFTPVPNVPTIPVGQSPAPYLQSTLQQSQPAQTPTIPMVGAPAPSAAPPAQQQQQPSMEALLQQILAALQPPQIDMGAIRSRAQNDAQLQVQALRNQAQQNYNRFQTEGQSQIGALNNLYSSAYRDNELNTVGAARGAVQQAANRGFFSSGLSADAELRARLAGEQERMRLQGQQTSQIGEIQNRLNLSGQEYGDMLQSLTGREAQLVQSLIDAYAQDERQFGLQNRGLTSDIALRLLGMDQSYSQFSQGLNWDKDKFAQQLAQGNNQFNQQMQYNQEGRNMEYGDRWANRLWQSNESAAQRDWQAQQSALQRQTQVDLAQFDANTRMALQQSQQAWQAGQNSLDRADANSRWQIETGLKVKWQEEQMRFDQSQFAWRQNESMYDRQTRQQAAMSQWTAFADGALQAGKWQSFDQAVRDLDAYSARIISDGVDMTQLYEYVKRRFGFGVVYGPGYDNSPPSGGR